uniref:Uncharacterized protein n=1 Tax=Trichobilharzia regenti TaxID=157069 RepID=A0AA85K3N0_TRIRE|nr:unnamed protein product [Trichobilharzia regenti]
MVYFAYNHIAFISLLALTAINSGEIPGIMSDLENAEGRVQNLTEKILSQNASLRGEIEKYTDCLETAYTYSWGQAAFTNIFQNFPRDANEKLGDVKNCVEQEASAYQKKKAAFPTDKCFENLPSARYEDLDQLNKDIYQLFQVKYRFTIETYNRNVYESQLKMLLKN